MMLPKIAENTPRSETWNQAALTLINDIAEYDWKYMFSAQIVLRYASSIPPPPNSPNLVPMPKSRFATVAPPAPISIAFRPPILSAIKPFTNAERPYTRYPTLMIAPTWVMLQPNVSESVLFAKGKL